MTAASSRISLSHDSTFRSHRFQHGPSESQGERSQDDFALVRPCGGCGRPRRESTAKKARAVMFELVTTRSGSYFAFRPNGSLQLAESFPGKGNIATFLNTEMNVERMATGLFQTDLTSNDDFLVAILSLLLLLVVQGILSSILLRKTTTGAISNFAFSISHFVHLLRDFRFQRSLCGRGQAAGKAAINSRVAIVAILVMLITFGLEFLILFFTSPALIGVTNEVASFEISQPVTPRWREVRRAGTRSTTPCSVVFLAGVEQQGTRITTCMISNLESQPFVPVPSDTSDVQLVIRSDVHDYGAEHSVSLGGVSANYSAMAYYRLDDGKARVISERSVRFDRFKSMKFVHKTLIGFLLSAYNEDTDEDRFTVAMLNKLSITHSNSNGPNIIVIKINNIEKFVRVVSDRYSTRVKIPDIGAGPVLSLSRALLKSMIAVKVSGPDTKDLLMGSGSRTENKSVLWYETSRTINWLTLIITLVGGFLILFGLRTASHTVSSVDIAGVLVKQLVGAQRNRSPIELDDGEDKRFRIEWDIDNEIGRSDVRNSDGNTFPWIVETQTPSIRHMMGMTTASEQVSSEVENSRTGPSWSWP